MKKENMRTFQTGATRGSDTDKIDPEAALSPLVLEAYCSYMRKYRLEGPGKPREDDNWQKGIPIASYMKSLLRHVLEAWRAYRANEPMEEALYAVMFNTMGMLHEKLKKQYGVPYVNEQGDNCTLVNAAATPPMVIDSRGYIRPIQTVPYEQWRKCISPSGRPYRKPPPIPTSTKTIKRPESEQEWLEFHENMRRSSLPNEASYRDLVLQEQVDQADLQYDPSSS